MAPTRYVVSPVGEFVSERLLKNRHATVPPTPTPKRRARPGVNAMSRVQLIGGSLPATTVTVSCVQNSPPTLPANPFVTERSVDAAMDDRVGIETDPCHAQATPGRGRSAG